MFFKSSRSIKYAKKGFNKLDVGNSSDALLDFKKAITLNPDNVMALNGIGIIKADLGDYQDALKYFAKAIEIAPSLAESYLYRGSTKLHFKIPQLFPNLPQSIWISGKWTSIRG